MGSGVGPEYACQENGCKEKNPRKTFGVMLRPFFDTEYKNFPTYFCDKHRWGKDYRGKWPVSEKPRKK